MIDFLNPPQIRVILTLPLKEGDQLIDHTIQDEFWILVFKTTENDLRTFLVNLEEDAFKEIIDLPPLQ